MAEDFQKPMTLERKKRLLGWGLVGIMVFLFAGLAMAVLVYSKIETTLQESQMAYANEQGRTERLTQKAEVLLKAVEEGQARERTLRESQRAFKGEKVGLEGDVAKLEAAVVRWQSAYSTEQAKTKMLTKTAKDLLAVMEQAQAQLKSLENGLKVSQKEKASMEEKTRSFETALTRWQTAHAAEQTKNRMLNERAEKLTKLAERSQDRVYSFEQAEKGRNMVIDKEREWKEKAGNWGKGFRKALNQIFF